MPIPPSRPRPTYDPQKFAEYEALLAAEQEKKAKRKKKTVVDENQLSLFDEVA